nr:YkgJ family cysteine cluster protein [Methylotetracoccus sp.]
FFAPTTDFRVSFWESLTADPMAAPADAGGRREPSCVAARLALWRASRPRWAAPLRDALQASAAIAAAMRRATQGDGVRRVTGTARPSNEGRMPSLWTTVQEVPARHPARDAPVADYYAGHGCRDCAWSFTRRRGRRCRQAPESRLPVDAPPCTSWEPAEELDCAACGACCREAYHAVEVGPREPVVRAHPALVTPRDGRYRVRRDGERCAALIGGTTPTERYACAIYHDRPRTCRDFARGSTHCLDARRRVGLSL